ncbi:AMP-dependent synthetase and ligase [Methylobacterium sp. 4-46]|uniref:AMP-dependent synthetase/ligase n=1 Tax=unclassified Methylobacterium TaxID=2615210 RepID=UPI000152D290|nr:MULTISPECIES: AMP-binding protein [Methylobacterium]ACA17298.1 AMP-dependent synthetase and ligase [Methylobacterium sp. 4-46]WFT82985.1 AMP-binding protein [Methylobacterium nodulans]
MPPVLATSDPSPRPPGAEAGTIPALLQAHAARRPAATAYVAYDPDAGRFASVSWAELAARVAARAAALSREGLTAGDRVALWLPNGVEWVAFDQAALSLGLVVVTLFSDDARATTAALLTDSGARVVVARRAEEWHGLRSCAGALGTVRRVIVIEEAGASGTADPRLRGLGAWLAKARGSLPPRVPLDPDALATIIYTSGTTGLPKGVMLSHRNLLSVAQAVLDRNPGSDRDVFLSYLPLAHVFERVVGCYLPLILGARVVFARSVEHLPDDLRVARPTILLVVPSLLDRLRRTVTERAARTAPTRWLLRAALARGWDLFAARRDGCRLGLARTAAGALLRAVAAAPIRRSLGGRLRLAVSGGAPLPDETARFCLGLGLPLVEGYGLTEAASAVTGFQVGRTVPGSVGPPLPGMEVRIADTGEILVRSPGVMIGYWRRPDLTAQVLHGGWLYTGDLGVLRGGCLYVAGRKKEMIVLSTGEKVSPEAVEAAITRDPLFRQAMAVGEGQSRLTVLAVVDEAAWAPLARRLGLDPEAEDALDRPAARQAALARIAAALEGCPRAARVKDVRLQRTPWTVEAGLVTPTRKLRRAALLGRFANEIAAMRGGPAAPAG